MDGRDTTHNCMSSPLPLVLTGESMGALGTFMFLQDGGGLDGFTRGLLAGGIHRFKVLMRSGLVIG